jgi:hypothetical protein
MNFTEIIHRPDDRVRRGSQAPRILMFSQRNIYEKEVWRCPIREFEGLVENLDSVELVAPSPAPWYPTGKRAALRFGEHVRRPINPGIPKKVLDKDYDIFFAVCEKPSELLNINAVRGWKDRCRTSVCWLTEFYVKNIETHRSCVEVLSQFDFVFSFFPRLDPFKRVLGGQCSYLPGGVDAIRFCPYPNPPARSVDVLSIGRRSERTHQALLESAERDGIFYLHDTFSNLAAIDLDQHRLLIANMVKRSRYFIANPGKIDSPEETDNTSEFGCRYFEGAAGGALIIGERPRNAEYERIFDWEDALIEVPFGAENIADIIHELDKQPERQAAARRTNVVKMLLHHDWAYRWEHVLNVANVPLAPQLVERKHRLKQLADYVTQAPTDH